MENRKVSVIIPVYNVEPYLRECVDSILNQTLRDIELICVDDGSTDRSLDILREYEKKDERVIVLTQENLGGGAARNKGLAIARGKYLSFLDADDFFEKTMLEEAYERCEKRNAQICIYQVQRYDTNTGKTWFDTGSFRSGQIPDQAVFSRKDMPDYILNTFQNWAWNKLIRHDLVRENQLRFQETRRTNDFLFVACCMVLAERITVLEKKLVYYRVGMKTNCQATNYQYPTEFLKAYRAVKDFLEEKGIYEEVKNSYLNQILSGCIYNLNSLKNAAAKNILYDELKQNAFSMLGLTGQEAGCIQEYNKKNYEAYLFIMDHSLEMYEQRFGEGSKDASMKMPRLYRKQTGRERRKEMPKVSIIIPTYNVAEYLVECLESVVRQTLQDIEIICVNDGSTDNSLEIIKRYAEADERIIVVDKENGGYGMAMNIGMSRATGEYIGIVEPDDFILLTMYEDLYAVASDNHLDFVKADFYRFKRDAKSNDMSLTYFALSKNPEDYNKVFDPSDTPDAIRYVMNTWSGIYRREFLEEHHIRHHETPGASFQDNGFYFQTFVYAKRGMILNTPYYMNRRDNPNSSVHSREKVYCMNMEYDYIREILRQDGEIWKKFKYMYWFKKFSNYMATLDRIGDEYKKEYVMRISDEFRRAKEMGELKKEVYSQSNWDSIQFLIADPEGFYFQKLMPDKMKMECARATRKLNEIKKSTSYRLGFWLTAIPRRIKEYLKKRG